MKLAYIPPFDLLPLTRRTDYQLMLPHLIGNVDYASMYREHGDNPDQFVILDNGEAEGEQQSWEGLMEIARVFNVDEMVLPDVMGDSKATRDAVANTIFDNRLLKRVGLMFVLQGQSMQEILNCADDAMSYRTVTTLGIPRHLPTTLGYRRARWDVLEQLTQRYENRLKPVHFLGMNPDVPKEMEYGLWNMPLVRGFDTSAPFNYAHAAHEMDLFDADVKYVNGFSRPSKYFERIAGEFSEPVLYHNMAYLERFTQG